MERPSDVLPTPGGPEQAEDRTLLVLLELADREVLEDALFDLLEAVVVLVEDLAHRGDVEVVGGRLGPGDVEDPVEVGADDGVFGGADLHRAEALELLLRDLLGLRREVRLGDAILEAVEIALVAVVLAELLLDGLELLAEDVFSLVFAHLLLDLGVDALAHLEDLELAGEEAEDLADALLRLDRLDELGLLLDGGVEVRGDEIGEGAGGLDGVDERAGLARELRHELDHLLGDVAQAHREGLGLDVLRLRLVEALDLGLHVRGGLRDGVEPDAGEALEHERVVAGRVLERLEHARGAADGVEVLLPGIVRGRIALREDGDHRTTGGCRCPRRGRRTSRGRRRTARRRRGTAPRCGSAARAARRRTRRLRVRAVVSSSRTFRFLSSIRRIGLGPWARGGGRNAARKAGVWQPGGVA
jgi:hypothetical protein